MANIIRFSDLTPENLSDPWFAVYRLPGEVYALYEPHHFQDVISYLILGKERALLLDTGMGIGNIRAVAERLTKLPITVVNSHSHFDHVGDNWRFEEVRLLNCPEKTALLEKGFRLKPGDPNLRREAFRLPDPLWFEPKDLQVRACKVRPTMEGEIFELGGRRLRVVAAPGHSEDGLMLAEDEKGLLFTGDTVYPGPLYAHRTDSRPELYRDTIRRLAGEFSEYTLYCSHNAPVWEGKALREIEKAFERILEEKRKKSRGSSCGPIEYHFDGFSIIA